MDSARLVGRDQELRLLREQLDRARAGEARIVFVSGEAGVGKTSLVRAALEGAAESSVLHASGEESEQHLTYSAVDQLLHGLGAPAAAQAGPTPVAVGATLLTALSDAQAASSLVVVWVDDLQWIDASSQQAIAFAVRRLRADSVCVVLCCRDDAESSLSPGVARLRSDSRAVVLDVAGLTARDLIDVADEAGVSLPLGAARRLREHTGGNPLWAKALLRDLEPGHLQDIRRSLPAPRAFADVVAGRLRRLSADARALVEASAVAATDWPLGSLGAVAEVADPYKALAEGVEAELLREVNARPSRVRPVHSLVSAAVVSNLDVDRRADIHTRLARVATSEHERLHHEVAASPGNDDDLAVRVEAVGREQLLEGAWATAASTLSTAAHLSSDPDRRLPLAEEAMAMALLAGDVAQATVLSGELAALPDRPRSLSLQGWLALAQGRPGDAEPLLRRAILRAEADVESQSRMILAQLLIFGGRAREAVPQARRAAELAAPGTPAAGHARGLLGVALSTAGDAIAAVSTLGDLDPSDGDPNHFPMLVARGSALVMGADYEQAARELELVAARTDRYGMLQFSCVLHAQASRALYVLGDWASAIDHAERAVNATDVAELAWALGPTHSTAAQTYARMGGWALAEQHTRTALRAADEMSDPVSISYAYTAAAVLARCRGEPAEVLAAVDPILAIAHRDGTDEAGILDWPVVHIEALLAMGRVIDARERLTVFAGHVARLERPFPLAEVARLRGALARARGKPDEAAHHLEIASDLADRAGATYEKALVLMELGRALSDMGRREEAAGSLLTARETLARLCAQPDLGRTTDLLDELGTAGPRPSPRGPGLTPQEIAVSRLVRKGLSNREIAAELFLSTKTVEFHLRHVYMKLGISSRTQLVARSAELLDLRAADDLANGPLGAAQDE